MKKVKFIYNPFSGENEILKHLDTIIHLYQQQSMEIVPFRISMETPLENAFITLDESYERTKILICRLLFFLLEQQMILLNILECLLILKIHVKKY